MSVTIHADAADVSEAVFIVKDRRKTETEPSPLVRVELPVSAFVSTVDGAIVLQIDTPADIGRFRVYVNDAPVFDADPDTGEDCR